MKRPEVLSWAAWIGNGIALVAGMAVAAHNDAAPAPVISYLLSLSHNAQHQMAAIVGLFLSALLLSYAIRTLASVPARICLWAGCMGLAVMALLAPHSNGLGKAHDILSACTLTSLLLGILMGILQIDRTTPHPGLRFFLYLVIFTITLLVIAYLLPDYFNNQHWWRNLAVAEWSLIALIQLGIALLMKYSRQPDLHRSKSLA